jgi:hypothetical protein
MRTAAMRVTLILIMVLGFGSGCVTGERMEGLRPGMTKDEVIARLGNPDSYQNLGDSEALRYTNRLISGWSWDRADFSVILTKGRVTDYGAGTVRQSAGSIGGLLLLVPVR